MFRPRFRIVFMFIFILYSASLLFQPKTYLAGLKRPWRVLGAAGLLQSKRATTHWMSHEMLAELGAIPVSERVVIDEKIITGGGVTAGIDFALRVAAELHGQAVAERIQRLANYAVDAEADAVLFTCSAFGPAIASAGAALEVPVLKPNEAMFETALDIGGRIGLLVSFEASVASLRQEFFTK